MTTHHPTARRSAAEQAKFHDAMTQLWEQRIRFNQVLGLTVLSLQPGDVRARLDMRPELVGHYLYGRLHGGVISASLDAIGGMALMVALGEKYHDESAEQVMHRFGRMGTIDLRVDFLRQGIGDHFVGQAEVTRLGGRIGSTQMRMLNDQGTLIATAAASFVIA
ncbi:MAG TPA: thioesterase family protein [Rubrivivax sp.]|nr:thioesterase family protein [Rubrivivax sp.]HPO18644.1 thioesterase family protein [Rubrivivax sp.]